MAPPAEIAPPEAVAKPATAYAIQRELEMLSERCWRLRGFMAKESSDPALARSSRSISRSANFKLGHYRIFRPLIAHFFKGAGASSRVNLRTSFRLAKK